MYYGQNYVNEYEQAMILTWYELLSNFGGILSLVIGGSLMSVIEIIYYLSGYFGALFFRMIQHSNTKKKIIQNDVANLPPFIKSSQGPSFRYVE